MNDHGIPAESHPIHHHGGNGNYWTHFKFLWLFFCLFPALSPGAPIGETLPKGAIIAFLPQQNSKDYSDTKSLRKWLAAQGWAICDGTYGTPDLNYRMLLGTNKPGNAGKSIGSRTHSHRVRGDTGIAHGRRRVFRDGIRQQVSVPAEGHKHRLQMNTEKAEHLPLSTQVLYIIKIR